MLLQGTSTGTAVAATALIFKPSTQTTRTWRVEKNTIVIKVHTGLSSYGQWMHRQHGPFI